jgi:hypothetical protein
MPDQTPGEFGGGGYYAHDQPTLDRAALHGCLDEDTNTGDPLVCRECAFPPGPFDGDGTYVATRERHRWVFVVRDGIVYYDMTALCAVADFPPKTRPDWAAAEYERVE